MLLWTPECSYGFQCLTVPISCQMFLCILECSLGFLNVLMEFSISSWIPECPCPECPNGHLNVHMDSLISLLILQCSNESINVLMDPAMFQ